MQHTPCLTEIEPLSVRRMNNCPGRGGTKKGLTTESLRLVDAMTESLWTSINLSLHVPHVCLIFRLLLPNRETSHVRRMWCVTATLL